MKTHNKLLLGFLVFALLVIFVCFVLIKINQKGIDINQDFYAGTKYTNETEFSGNFSGTLELYQDPLTRYVPYTKLAKFDKIYSKTIIYCNNLLSEYNRIGKIEHDYTGITILVRYECLTESYKKVNQTLLKEQGYCFIDNSGKYGDCD